MYTHANELDIREFLLLILIRHVYAHTHTHTYMVTEITPICLSKKGTECCEVEKMRVQENVMGYCIYSKSNANGIIKECKRYLHMGYLKFANYSASSILDIYAIAHILELVRKCIKIAIEIL